MTLTRSLDKTAPQSVHELLGSHILADGMPMVLDLEKSRGTTLVDARDGREYIDLFTCFSTCPVGYSHPKLEDPAFLEDLMPAAINKPSNSDLYTTQMADFVAALSRTIPAPLNQRLFFIEGGALAVENTLKTAFDWKARKNRAAGKSAAGSQAMHFRQAFHGRSGYTMSLTNTDPTKTDLFPKFSWPRIHNPALSFPVTEEVLARVIQEEEQAVAEIQQALVDHPDDIACLIIEPIQGEGGDKHFRGEFFRKLRQLADENEFLLIFDEVQTGFGATGRWWCFEHFDVLPDVFAFGKKTQVCGIAASERVDEVDSVFKVSSRINSTWGGNLVDMVRCRRYVEIIEEDDLLASSRAVGAHLVSGLESLMERFPGKVTNARGRGLFTAFDLPDTETQQKAIGAIVDAGVLGLTSGERSIRFRPALTLTTDTADEALERIERSLASLF